MDHLAQADFFERMRTAPFEAHKFVQALHDRFDRRNDVQVHYTNTNNADLRLRVFWVNANGKDDAQNFARFAWQNKNEVFYCETYVAPQTLKELGFEDAKAHNNGPLLSQVRIGADYWDNVVDRDVFFRSLDLACLDLTRSR